jgi:lysophosphatidylcholine acyltransferase/lyso-PAF acetyltransferase
MEVTELPTYYPSQQEKDDPKLYASNVRRLMATEVCKLLSIINISSEYYILKDF